MDNRAKLVFLLTVQEKMQRYEDMISTVRTLVKTVYEVSPCEDTKLSAEVKKEAFTAQERNLLASSYKNIVFKLRAAHRDLSHGISKLVDSPCTALEKFRTSVVEEYYEDISSLMVSTCSDCIDTVEFLVKSENDKEAYIFYKKMIGDYHRYVAEVVSGMRRDTSVKEAHDAYAAAWSKSRTHHEAWDPVRLGLALNFAVFLYETRYLPTEACAFARDAFQDAIKAIRFNSKPVNKSSHLLLQMMQDNLAMWSSKHSKVSEIVSMPGKTESKKETKLAEEKVNIHRISRPIADFSKLA